MSPWATPVGGRRGVGPGSLFTSVLIKVPALLVPPLTSRDGGLRRFLRPTGRAPHLLPPSCALPSRPPPPAPGPLVARSHGSTLYVEA